MSYQRTYKKWCAYCHAEFQGEKLQTYCCHAHKQAAYRQRKTTPMERAIAKVDRYKRMVATKAATMVTIKCCGCGCEMTVTALQGRGTMYHNNACRQRAYRERKAYRENLLRDKS